MQLIIDYVLVSWSVTCEQINELFLLLRISLYLIITIYTISLVLHLIYSALHNTLYKIQEQAFTEEKVTERPLDASGARALSLANVGFWTIIFLIQLLPSDLFVALQLIELRLAAIDRCPLP